MNKSEPVNKAYEFIHEYRDVIALEVFEHAAIEYRQYLEKQVMRRCALLEKELDEKSYRQIRAMDEQISVMLGFFGIVEETLKIFSQKTYQHLSFDAIHWERYKAIERENEQWIQLYNQKLKEKVYDGK